ncbi:hypothetical protein NCCP2716_30100 [Sporosarcina sp. NCCP-2716]|nr:hypothetical protein NCCP2716_30100 [Sporosarcina sp. NCCP-2716]
MLWASVLFVLVVGFLSGLIRIQYVVLVNVVAAIVSVALASNYIVDDNDWFNPIGRNLAIIFTAIVFLIGQLFVRTASKKVFYRR